LQFDSIEFLVLLTTTFAAFRLAPAVLRIPILIAASVVFYCSWNAPFVFLIAISAVVDFFAARRIYAEHVAGRAGRKRLWLVLSLLVNLGLLGYFKYTNFLIGSLHEVFPDADAFARTWDIVLPIGISFYTFQTMSYSIDVYRGTIAPTRNFLGFLLYVSFFPQLIAGPIERAPHLLPQILESSRGRLRKEEFFTGLLLIVWGLFKKVALSDNLAMVVEPAYTNPQAYGGGALLAATYAFAFQIFLDFSAYSDIARGAAALFGIKLVRNFNLPYMAQDPSDFWRRWHISLSLWIRDYLYIALGGSRGTAARTMFNLALTMALAGLWHGASWNFIVWGLFHGGLLVFYRILGPAFARLFAPVPARVQSVLRIALMFHLVCVGWVFFRAETLADSLVVVSEIAAWSASGWSAAGPSVFPAAGIALLALAFAVMAWQEHRDVWRRITSSQVGYGLLIGACLVAMAVLMPATSAQFIYFQF